MIGNYIFPLNLENSLNKEKKMQTNKEEKQIIEGKNQRSDGITNTVEES
jgi:hypothetical protein